MLLLITLYLWLYLFQIYLYYQELCEMSMIIDEKIAKLLLTTQNVTNNKMHSFIIMVKGMKDFIRGIIEENQGGFENSRGEYVDRYDVYGITGN